MNVCIIIPAYNAAVTLPPLLQALLPHNMPVLVVDDGSDDATAETAETFASQAVTIIRHSENLGKGAALRTGMNWLVQKGFDAAITMDSDLQHSPSELPGLLEIFEREKLDLLIGSRLHDQRDMPRSRRLGNWFSSWVATYLCCQKIFDSQCGYRIYRLKSFKNLINEITLDRFDFESEVLLQAATKLLRIGFAPITVIYPKDSLHKSFYRPWVDTFRILSLAGKQLIRRTFTMNGQRKVRNLKNYVKSSSDWPRYYQLPGAGKKNSLE